MWKQIRLLTAVQLSNAYGINEMRYGKDKKKKKRFVMLCFTMALVGIMIMFYTGTLSMVFATMGVARLIPSYLITISCIIILFFSLFKAGSIIFNIKMYERTVVLPLSPMSIIISRFLTMYVSDLIFSCFVMIPGSVIYALAVNPSVLYYIFTLLGIVLIPLIPLTIATILGTGVTAISARFKFKKAINNVLSMAIILCAVFLPQIIVNSFEIKSSAEVQNLFVGISEKINAIYPPAYFYSESVVNGNILTFLLFLVISVALISAFVFLIKNKFNSICTLLNSTSTKNNYVMQRQHKTTQLKALYFKEIKRYFSSSMYVMNTIMGNVMSVIFSFVILFAGFSFVEQIFMTGNILKAILPFIISFLIIISPTTSSSISIEGKQWWIVKSLPIRTKSIFDSKLLVNLTFAIPAYIISVIVLLIALQPSIVICIEMIVVPLVYIFFGTILGLTINIKMPMFVWESDTTVVKQSSSVLFTMLFSFLSVLIPCVLMFVVPQQYSAYIIFAFSAILAIIAAVMYRKNNKIILNTIQ